MMKKIRIDSHMHYMGDTDESLELLEQFNLKMLNICVVDDPHGEWRWQADVYHRLAQENAYRYAWCTGFDLPRFDDHDYIEDVIDRLGHDFDYECGAVACKVWKNFGMGVRKPSGENMMVDDPMLEPIFSYIADRNRTLIAHIADPLDCWLPLREDSVHYGYYTKNPEWHLYQKPDVASHQQLMDARDAVVARHPKLRIVGAHLGSLEHDVDEVAKRFDLYPNFAVDMSARLLDLALQDTDKVRAFFIKYQDRILFGADMGTWGRASEKSEEDRRRQIGSIARSYGEHFQYLETDGPVTIRNREVRGIGLPPEVLMKVYNTNAHHWFSGI